MFSAAEAARFLDEAHRARARYQNLPEAIAPTSTVEAYQAQDELCRLWAPRLGAVAGLKIATTTKVMQQLMGIDHPCMGAIFASRVHTSPARIPKRDFVNLRVESELAVRLAHDLPKAGAPYKRETVLPAVGEVMAAFELIEDRGADYKTCKALTLIADNAWNGGIVVGTGKPPATGSDLNGLAASLRRNGKEEAAGRSDDPLGALAWLANVALMNCRQLMAGMVVITGSIVPIVDVAPGDRLDFAIDGVGDVSMTAE